MGKLQSFRRHYDIKGSHTAGDCSVSIFPARSQHNCCTPQSPPHTHSLQGPLLPARRCQAGTYPRGHIACALTFLTRRVSRVSGSTASTHPSFRCSQYDSAIMRCSTSEQNARCGWLGGCDSTSCQRSQPQIHWKLDR